MFQSILAAAALAAASLVPPTRGPVLLIPLGADQAAAIRIATAHGGLLLGPARADGILVRAVPGMLRPLLAAGIVPIAAPRAACGSVAA